MNIKKMTAIVTSACFIVTSVAGQAAFSAFEMHRNATQFSEVLDQFVIPTSVGRITKGRYFGSDKVVVNIQDLHCHPEVQRNISRMLGILSDKYKVSNVYVEGAAGNVSTAWINDIKDKDLRKEIVESLIDQGKLTGTEYYSITQGKFDLLKGVEDEKPFKDNIVRLGKIIEKQDVYAKELSAMRKDLALLQERHFNSKNRRFNRILQDYKDKKITTEKFYSILAKYVEKINADPEKYNNLFTLRKDDYGNMWGYLAMVEKGQRIKYRRVAKELQEFINVLKAKLPYQAYNFLLKKTDNFSKLDELYIYLSKFVKEYDLKLEGNYPNLNEFFAYIDQSQAVNPILLIKEERRLVEDIRIGLSQDVTEVEISFLVDFFNYFEDYLTNHLTAEDYAYFVQRFPQFQAIWVRYTFTNRMENLAADFPMLNEFYRVNDQRNQYFLKNMFGDYRNLNPVTGQSKDGNTNIKKTVANLAEVKEVMVVVTGGFHTEGLEKLLNERGISYLEVTPNVTQDTRKSSEVYMEIARQQAKILENAIANAMKSWLIRGAPIEIIDGTYRINFINAEGKVIDTASFDPKAGVFTPNSSGIKQLKDSMQNMSKEQWITLIQQAAQEANNTTLNMIDPTKLGNIIHRIMTSSVVDDLLTGEGILYSVLQHMEQNNLDTIGGFSRDELAGKPDFVQTYILNHYKELQDIENMDLYVQIIAAALGSLYVAQKDDTDSQKPQVKKVTSKQSERRQDANARLIGVFLMIPSMLFMYAAALGMPDLIYQTIGMVIGGVVPVIAMYIIFRGPKKIEQQAQPKKKRPITDITDVDIAAPGKSYTGSVLDPFVELLFRRLFGNETGRTAADIFAIIGSPIIETAAMVAALFVLNPVFIPVLVVAFAALHPFARALQSSLIDGKGFRASLGDEFNWKVFAGHLAQGALYFGLLTVGFNAGNVTDTAIIYSAAAHAFVNAVIVVFNVDRRYLGSVFNLTRSTEEISNENPLIKNLLRLKVRSNEGSIEDIIKYVLAKRLINAFVNSKSQDLEQEITAETAEDFVSTCRSMNKESVRILLEELIRINGDRWAASINKPENIITELLYKIEFSDREDENQPEILQESFDRINGLLLMYLGQLNNDPSRLSHYTSTSRLIIAWAHPHDPIPGQRVREKRPWSSGDMVVYEDQTKFVTDYIKGLVTKEELKNRIPNISDKIIDGLLNALAGTPKVAEADISQGATASDETRIIAELEAELQSYGRQPQDAKKPAGLNEIEWLVFQIIDASMATRGYKIYEKMPPMIKAYSPRSDMEDALLKINRAIETAQRLIEQHVSPESEYRGKVENSWGIDKLTGNRAQLIKIAERGKYFSFNGSIQDFTMPLGRMGFEREKIQRLLSGPIKMDVAPKTSSFVPEREKNQKTKKNLEEYLMILWDNRAVNYEVYARTIKLLIAVFETEGNDYNSSNNVLQINGVPYSVTSMETMNRDSVRSMISLYIDKLIEKNPSEAELRALVPEEKENSYDSVIQGLLDALNIAPRAPALDQAGSVEHLTVYNPIIKRKIVLKGYESNEIDLRDYLVSLEKDGYNRFSKFSETLNNLEKLSNGYRIEITAKDLIKAVGFFVQFGRDINENEIDGLFEMAAILRQLINSNVMIENDNYGAFYDKNTNEIIGGNKNTWINVWRALNALLKNEEALKKVMKQAVGQKSIPAKEWRLPQNVRTGSSFYGSVLDPFVEYLASRYLSKWLGENAGRIVANGFAIIGSPIVETIAMVAAMSVVSPVAIPVLVVAFAAIHPIVRALKSSLIDGKGFGDSLSKEFDWKVFAVHLAQGALYFGLLAFGFHAGDVMDMALISAAAHGVINLIIVVFDVDRRYLGSIFDRLWGREVNEKEKADSGSGSTVIPKSSPSDGTVSGNQETKSPIRAPRLNMARVDDKFEIVISPGSVVSLTLSMQSSYNYVLDHWVDSVLTSLHLPEISKKMYLESMKENKSEEARQANAVFRELFFGKDYDISLSNDGTRVLLDRNPIEFDKYYTVGNVRFIIMHATKKLIMEKINNEKPLKVTRALPGLINQSNKNPISITLEMPNIYVSSDYTRVNFNPSGTEIGKHSYIETDYKDNDEYEIRVKGDEKLYKMYIMNGKEKIVVWDLNNDYEMSRYYEIHRDRCPFRLEIGNGMLQIRHYGDTITVRKVTTGSTGNSRLMTIEMEKHAPALRQFFRKIHVPEWGIEPLVQLIVAVVESPSHLLLPYTFLFGMHDFKNKTTENAKARTYAGIGIFAVSTTAFLAYMMEMHLPSAMIFANMVFASINVVLLILRTQEIGKETELRNVLDWYSLPVQGISAVYLLSSLYLTAGPAGMLLALSVYFASFVVQHAPWNIIFPNWALITGKDNNDDIRLAPPVGQNPYVWYKILAYCVVNKQIPNGYSQKTNEQIRDAWNALKRMNEDQRINWLAERVITPPAGVDEIGWCKLLSRYIKGERIELYPGHGHTQSTEMFNMKDLVLSKVGPALRLLFEKNKELVMVKFAERVMAPPTGVNTYDWYRFMISYLKGEMQLYTGHTQSSDIVNIKEQIIYVNGPILREIFYQLGKEQKGELIKVAASKSKRSGSLRGSILDPFIRALFVKLWGEELGNDRADLLGAVVISPIIETAAMAFVINSSQIASNSVALAVMVFVFAFLHYAARVAKRVMDGEKPSAVMRDEAKPKVFIAHLLQGTAYIWLLCCGFNAGSDAMLYLAGIASWILHLVVNAIIVAEDLNRDYLGSVSQPKIKDRNIVKRNAVYDYDIVRLSDYLEELEKDDYAKYELTCKLIKSVHFPDSNWNLVNYSWHAIPGLLKNEQTAADFIISITKEKLYDHMTTENAGIVQGLWKVISGTQDPNIVTYRKIKGLYSREITSNVVNTIELTSEMPVYIHLINEKLWDYSVSGYLIHEEGLTPNTYSSDEREYIAFTIDRIAELDEDRFNNVRAGRYYSVTLGKNSVELIDYEGNKLILKENQEFEIGNVRCTLRYIANGNTGKWILETVLLDGDKPMNIVDLKRKFRNHTYFEQLTSKHLAVLNKAYISAYYELPVDELELISGHGRVMRTGYEEKRRDTGTTGGIWFPDAFIFGAAAVAILLFNILSGNPLMQFAEIGLITCALAGNRPLFPGMTLPQVIKATAKATEEINRMDKKSSERLSADEELADVAIAELEKQLKRFANVPDSISNPIRFYRQKEKRYRHIDTIKALIEAANTLSPDAEQKDHIAIKQLILSRETNPFKVMVNSVFGRMSIQEAYDSIMDPKEDAVTSGIISFMLISALVGVLTRARALIGYSAVQDKHRNMTPDENEIPIEYIKGDNEAIDIITEGEQIRISVTTLEKIGSLDDLIRTVIRLGRNNTAQLLRESFVHPDGDIAAIRLTANPILIKELRDVAYEINDLIAVSKGLRNALMMKKAELERVSEKTGSKRHPAAISRPVEPVFEKNILSVIWEAIVNVTNYISRYVMSENDGSVNTVVAICSNENAIEKFAQSLPQDTHAVVILPEDRSRISNDAPVIRKEGPRVIKEAVPLKGLEEKVTILWVSAEGYDTYDRAVEDVINDSTILKKYLGMRDYRMPLTVDLREDAGKEKRSFKEMGLPVVPERVWEQLLSATDGQRQAILRNVRIQSDYNGVCSMAERGIELGEVGDDIIRKIGDELKNGSIVIKNKVSELLISKLKKAKEDNGMKVYERVEGNLNDGLQNLRDRIQDNSAQLPLAAQIVTIQGDVDQEKFNRFINGLKLPCGYLLYIAFERQPVFPFNVPVSGFNVRFMRRENAGSVSSEIDVSQWQAVELIINKGVNKDTLKEDLARLKGIQFITYDLKGLLEIDSNTRDIIERGSLLDTILDVVSFNETMESRIDRQRKAARKIKPDELPAFEAQSALRSFAEGEMGVNFDTIIEAVGLTSVAGIHLEALREEWEEEDDVQMKSELLTESQAYAETVCKAVMAQKWIKTNRGEGKAAQFANGELEILLGDILYDQEDPEICQVDITENIPEAPDMEGKGAKAVFMEMERGFAVKAGAYKAIKNAKERAAAGRQMLPDLVIMEGKDSVGDVGERNTADPKYTKVILRMA